jgi:hypothetical protein
VTVRKVPPEEGARGPALVLAAGARAADFDVSAKRTVVDERGGASPRRAEDTGRTKR